jgi:Fe(3+) dicitrate transport protein
LSYKPQNQIELYGNVSQNYRSWLLMISVPLVQATWLTPTYPMKRIYFRHWYTWTIRDKVTFDASIYGLYYNDKIGSMKLVTQMDLLL